MTAMPRLQIEDLTRAGRATITAAGVLVVALILLPAVAGGVTIDKLTTLFVYILLASMWNLLAGYAGLVSVGQQAFFGVSAYFALRLADFGVPPYPALLGAAVGAGLLSVPISYFIPRLRDGEFAIGTWVIAEVVRIAVMFDVIVQGETGTSLIALNAYDPDLRRNLTYWFALAAVAGILVGTFILIRSRIGAAAQAIRDDEDAARSLGVEVMRTRRIIFVLAAFGCALAGVIWLASAITFLPRTNFGIQWTVFMLFMVLTGGLRTLEGPVIGAVLFFLLQEFFGDFGVWYLFGTGAIAVGFALFLPDGLWGAIQRKTGTTLLPTGVILAAEKLETVPDRRGKRPSAVRQMRL
jgi:branched-chain amino acid transport system permease protein